MSTHGCLGKYAKKLVGRTDIEDALSRLDRLTQDEVRMAAAQGLKATHKVDERVQAIGDKAQSIDNKVQAVDDTVHAIDKNVYIVGDKVQAVDDTVHAVGDQMQVVDDKVQGVDDKVQGVDDRMRDVDDKIDLIIDGVQQVADDIGDQRRSSPHISLRVLGPLNCSHRRSDSRKASRLALSP